MSFLIFRFTKDILGYWSSGSRLVDSVKIGSECPNNENLPEYMVRAT